MKRQNCPCLLAEDGWQVFSTDISTGGRRHPLVFQGILLCACFLSPAKMICQSQYQLLCFHKYSVQFSSVAQLCPTLCEPMDCSTPGFPVHHQLPELSQTHMHRVGDAIQPSHPLLAPSHPLLAPCPPAFNPLQHQGIFQ